MVYGPLVYTAATSSHILLLVPTAVTVFPYVSKNCLQLAKVPVPLPQSPSTFHSDCHSTLSNVGLVAPNVVVHIWLKNLAVSIPIDISPVAHAAPVFSAKHTSCFKNAAVVELVAVASPTETDANAVDVDLGITITTDDLATLFVPVLFPVIADLIARA